MKKTNITFILFFLALFLSSSLYAQNINVSGHWHLDKERSVFGKIPASSVPQDLLVTQTIEQLSVKRTITDDQQKAHDYTEVLPFDGNEVETTVAYSGTVRYTTFHWGTGGKTLLISSESFKDDQPSNKITETWSLDDGGKTLCVERKTEQSNGFAYSVKGIYNKL